MANITLDGFKVVRDGSLTLDVDRLDIADGELLVLLGPSGAGKSTLLRAIAGLDPLASGSLYFDGVDMTGTKTAERGVAMVFQDHALYPFLDVRGNVAFPLKLRNMPRDEISERVEAEARVLEIEHLLARKPEELGAGHQQLVQAARALVRVPDVFLMDEPFARLDAHVRQQMRQEFKLLQRGYGVTTVFVTNDHEEAMVMADRIVVIDRGVICQVAPPLELYERPGSRFVAGFVGSMAFVEARLDPDPPGYWVRLGAFRVRAWAPALAAVAGGPVTIGIRPEDVVIDSDGVPVRVGRTEFLGSYAVSQLELVPGGWIGMRTDELGPTDGSETKIRLRRLHLFDPTTGRALGHVEGGAA